MKTAKAMPLDLSSSRRAQPIRQTRTNPPRSSGSLLRSFDSRGASGSGLAHLDHHTEFYPAITHFADAITALPKELVRHFTLLKEVDAKIFSPEETLEQLVEAALNCQPVERRHQLDFLQPAGHTSNTTSTVSSVNGSNTHGPSDGVTSAPGLGDSYDSSTAAWDPENLPRRQLFRQCSFTMQEMLVSLDEKNHVISTATEALNKQMWRLKDVFPHIENEVSEEARYGSTTHWAYTEMRVNKPVERPRRDIGTGSHAANGHQVSVDEAAARSELRKQAMLAKKGRTQHVESDFDDHDSRHKGDSGKRIHGNSKKARPAEAAVGLGITNGSSVHGHPPSKRRKVEKTANGGTGMERSLSSVFGTSGTASKATKANSPRDTPIPEGSKKKSKVATGTNGHSRKRTITNAMSPSIASSPIHSTFAESKGVARAFSPPANNGRPITARARQNSTQSIVESARQRPTSSASNKQNGAGGAAADLSAVASVTGRSISEVRGSMKESASNSKGEHMIEDTDKEDPEMRGGLVVGSRKDSILKREESIANGDSTLSAQIVQTTVTTTKSGRASKPSTPAIPQFQEPVRSRSARNALEQTATNKRSHKKGAGQAAQLIAAQTADDDATSSMQDEDEAPADEDEPTYCYCNGVSYGEMVGCDSDTCTREWFHLECVGLKVAPKGNAKWYCDDCKENMKNSKRFTR